jgi:hypothetical protein
MTDGTKPLLQSTGSQARFDMAKGIENQKRKRVLVVGAGAAGMLECSSQLTTRRMLTHRHRHVLRAPPRAAPRQIRRHAR